MGCGRWSISLPLSLVCSSRSLYPYYQVSTLHCQDHFLTIVIKQQQGHGAFWSLCLFSGISGYKRAKQAHSCMSPYLKTTKADKRKGRRKKKEEQKSGLSNCHLSFSDRLLWGVCTTNAVLRGAAFKLGRKHCDLQNSFLVTVSQLKRRCGCFGFCQVFFLAGQRAALFLR